MNQSNIPELHYLIRTPKVKTEKPPLLILLHGVGSNERSIFSFAETLPANFLIVSVRAPLSLGYDSFAWFEVDFSSGQPVINENQAIASTATLVGFIDDLRTVEQFDENNIFLMGFSQGGIMSYNVALTAPEMVKGIAVMSGRLLPEIKPFARPKDELGSLEIFISHGFQDSKLHYQYAKDAQLYLESLGLKPALHSYTADHTINHDMLGDVKQWLQANTAIVRQ